MAALTEFTCSHCHFRIESWSDGKPYLRGSDGQRHYFYHPCEPDAWEERFQIEHHRPSGTQAELHAFVEARVGLESHYLCMHCGRQTHRDPKHDSLRCTGCGKARLKNTDYLEAKRCPKCRQGTFHGEMTAIS
jgi:DNA-directed RNA polymerase subunit RPC12/RpoP